MASSSQVVDTVVEPVVEKKTKKGKTAKVDTVKVDTGASTSAVVSTEDQMASLVNQLSLLMKRVETLEGELQEMKGTQKDVPKPKKEEKEKKTRAPTAYNLFMKEKMLELKESHPTLTNIERMKMAAEAWSESKKSS
jgi:YABBY protein